MNPTVLVIAICGSIVAALNVVATVRLARAPWFSRGQAIAQFFFLWLVPIVGFALVWHFMNEMAPPKVTTDLRTWLESDEIANRLSNVPPEENFHSIDHGGSD
jgi:hypothetical protein